MPWQSIRQTTFTKCLSDIWFLCLLFFLTEHRNRPNQEDFRREVQRTEYRPSVPEPTSQTEQECGTKPEYGKAGVRGECSSQCHVTCTYLRHHLCWSWAPYLTQPLQQAPVSVLGLSNFCRSWNEPRCSWCLSLGLSFWDRAGGLVPRKPLALAFIASWHTVWTVVECVARQNF